MGDHLEILNEWISSTSAIPFHADGLTKSGLHYMNANTLNKDVNDIASVWYSIQSECTRVFYLCLTCNEHEDYGFSNMRFLHGNDCFLQWDM